MRAASDRYLTRKEILQLLRQKKKAERLPHRSARGLIERFWGRSAIRPI